MCLNFDNRSYSELRTCAIEVFFCAAGSFKPIPVWSAESDCLLGTHRWEIYWQEKGLSGKWSKGSLTDQTAMLSQVIFKVGNQAHMLNWEVFVLSMFWPSVKNSSIWGVCMYLNLSSLTCHYTLHTIHYRLLLTFNAPELLSEESISADSLPASWWIHYSYIQTAECSDWVTMVFGSIFKLEMPSTWTAQNILQCVSSGPRHF